MEEAKNGVRKVEVETAKGKEENKKELGPQASANVGDKAVAGKDSPKKQANNSQNKQRHRSDSGKQNGSNATANADQRRTSYNRNNKQYRSFEQNRKKNPHGYQPGGKPRSGSTAQVVAQGSVEGGWRDSKETIDASKKTDKKNDDKKRTQSTNSSGRRSRASNTSMNSNNGESFDYGDYDELDEPFSDSDDDTFRHREVQKPSLQIPRGRIRTLSGTVPPVGYSPRWGGPTMCLSCLEFFDLPDQVDRFSEHLLTEHHIVVEEMELIVDPKRYVEHWRQRFAKEGVDKIFPKIVPDAENPYHGKTDYYFEFSERIPEDYSLRQRLAMRRLEEALGCQQREREESTFSMQCIFCRYVARGNRSKIIHHLYMIHHLNLGSPDNLVFVHEYIDHLKEKLHRNECIYCEKTFTDRNILMDHMRKRNHREVNPKNNYYDKFYIINYLELGKRWLDVLAEDFEDTMPTFVDSDDEEEEESWHEWQEDNTDEDQLRVVCLYCDDSHEKVQPLLQHMADAHKFDLVDYVEKEKLDNYGRMRLLNFIRKHMFNTPNYRARNSEAEHIVAKIPDRSEWDDPENLVPMFGNDHFLWMFESYLEEKRPELANVITEDESEIKSAQKAIEHSKANTVDGVIPEDLPELSNCSMEDEELIKSLRQ